MAWVDVRRGDYGLFLTDGYLSAELLAKRAKRAYGAYQRNELSLERLAAERLYQLGKPSYPGAPAHLEGTDPLHVWVVGRGDWLDAVPEQIEQIVKDERDPAYRIVIAGLGIPPHYVGAWPDHVYAAGIQRKKRHVVLAYFQEAGRSLLTSMADYYNRSGEDPSPVLRNLGLPLEFVGD